MPDPNAERLLAEKDRELSSRDAAVIDVLGLAMAEATKQIEELVAGLPEGSPSREIAWTAVQPEGVGMKRLVTRKRVGIDLVW